MGIVTKGQVGGRLDYQLLFRKETCAPPLKRAAEIEPRVVVVVVVLPVHNN